MTSNFLERNKKKSLLAALLLFLRQRKMLALLLLLVIGATTVFLTPSSFLVDLPGGSRAAAGIAWLAARMGVDVSRWGLAPGRISFNDLLASFQSARSGSRRSGWGAFFKVSERAKAAAAAAAGDGSVAFVRGSMSELGRAGAGNGAGGSNGAGQIQAIVDPTQAAKDDAGVTLSESDITGQRESLVKNAFAGGFFNGLVAGAGDANALSGGAYAGRGFFSGSAGTVSSGPGAIARSGLQNLPTVGNPAGSNANGMTGRISGRFAQQMDARAAQGVAGASSLGTGRAYTQLAQGNGQAQISEAPNCVAPNCPGEYAATNTGAIYDGNAVNSASQNGIIMATPLDGVTTPNIPNTGIAQGYINSANQMNQDAQTCQNLDNQYGPQEDALNAQMQTLSQQFQAAGCGSGGCSQSKINYCQGLGNQMQSTCGQYMAVRCQHTKACPLTANDAATTCTSECQQIGNGVNAQQVVVNPDQNNNTDAQGTKSA